MTPAITRPTRQMEEEMAWITEFLPVLVVGGGAHLMILAALYRAIR